MRSALTIGLLFLSSVKLYFTRCYSFFIRKCISALFYFFTNHSNLSCSKIFFSWSCMYSVYLAMYMNKFKLLSCVRTLYNEPISDYIYFVLGCLGKPNETPNVKYFLLFIAQGGKRYKYLLLAFILSKNCHLEAKIFFWTVEKEY